MNHRVEIDGLSPNTPAIVLILRNHLWVEKCLNDGLRAALRVPEALDEMRLTFGKRLLLARALGLLDQDEFVGLDRLNDLRNALAHDIEAELDEKRKRDFINGAGPEVARITQMQDRERAKLGVTVDPSSLDTKFMNTLLAMRSIAEVLSPQEQAGIDAEVQRYAVLYREQDPEAFKRLSLDKYLPPEDPSDKSD